jgi:hypothetical protein
MKRKIKVRRHKRKTKQGSTIVQIHNRLINSKKTGIKKILKAPRKIKPFTLQKGNWNIRVTNIRKVLKEEPFLSDKVTIFKFKIIATKNDNKVEIKDLELMAEDLEWFKIKLLSELRRMNF